MPRMRIARKVHEIIAAEDPDTDVTLHYIRGLISSGKIPHVNVGRKKLVDVDAVISYIASGDETQKEAAPMIWGGIRKVAT